LDRSRVALIIPAFNEATTIGHVIADVRQYGQVIVIDDASSDGTAAIATQAGALVKRNSTNLQYDRALEVGLKIALDEGYEYAVTFDADGEHDARDIPALLAALRQGADLVVGIRAKPARIAEAWFAMAGSWFWGLSDPLCGMKAYRLSWLERYGTLDTHRSIGTELAIRMLCDGAQVDQIPINILLQRKSPRFGGVLMANFRILRALAFAVWHYSRQHGRLL
jgi:glycosyltransferase involved in cell wall biosynthesis